MKAWEETPDEDIEEERRLCYVGMTRAPKRLYLMHAVMRRLWGNTNFADPSRFFDEMPEVSSNFAISRGGAAPIAGFPVSPWRIRPHGGIPASDFRRGVV